MARDLAQTAIVAKGAAGMAVTASLTANAEHSVLIGNPAAAVKGLTQAYNLVGKIRLVKAPTRRGHAV